MPSPKARAEAGASVDVKAGAELVPAEVAKASYYKVDQAAPGPDRESSPITTPSSSAPARASAGCRRRWRTFS